MKNTKNTIAKIVALILALVTVTSLLVSCGAGKKQIVGKWYFREDECITVRSDGTWKGDGIYGSGKWKYLSDEEVFEFTDFYGEVDEVKIEKDENGEYFKYNRRTCYKDGYPSGK